MKENGRLLVTKINRCSRNTIEFSELRRISWPQDTVYFSNLNNKKYLIDELADINKIEEVSMKFQNKDSDIQECKIKTKTRSGKNSIYVEAFQLSYYSRKINLIQARIWMLAHPALKIDFS